MNTFLAAMPSWLLIVIVLLAIWKFAGILMAGFDWLLCRDDEDTDIRQAELTQEPDGTWKATLLDDPDFPGNGATPHEAVADLINGRQEELGLRIRMFLK